MLAGEIAEGDAVGAVVRAFHHEGVVSRKHIAHHGAHVIQAGNGIVLLIAHAHLRIGGKAAQHGEEDELSKVSPFTMAPASTSASHDSTIAAAFAAGSPSSIESLFQLPDSSTWEA